MMEGRREVAPERDSRTNPSRPPLPEGRREDASEGGFLSFITK